MKDIVEITYKREYCEDVAISKSRQICFRKSFGKYYLYPPGVCLSDPERCVFEYLKKCVEAKELGKNLPELNFALREFINFKNENYEVALREAEKIRENDSAFYEHKMQISKVEESDYDAVRMFYHSVIDDFEGMPYHPCWEKDIYPSPQQLRELISDGEMYIGSIDREIVSAMAVNHSCNESYYELPWKNPFEEKDVAIIHMLAVLPKFGKQGIGNAMVRFAKAMSTVNGIKAIRLDVLKGNLPANKLYEGCGFQKCHTQKMYYTDTGWTEFELYELVL